MPKTIDLEINKDLRITFSNEGQILNALTYSEGIQDWVDCTQIVLKSKYWTGIARDEFADYMENKEDDWEIE